MTGTGWPRRRYVDDRHRLQLRRKLERGLGRANRRVWEALPIRMRGLKSGQAYGRWIHALTSRTADREMYVGTLFLRNRPALELIHTLSADRPDGTPMKVAVLGCSIGVEVYSILWALRRDRPDLHVVTYAVDISPEVLAIAERAVYGPQASEAVQTSLFQQLTDTERREMFDWDGDQARIKPWLREGITWRVGDAADPDLVDGLGPMDLVVANNFLCHMDAPDAEQCLRNLARLARDDGYIFVSGVDLNVRTRVAVNLGWLPVPELLEEIHDGDQLVRNDWPCRWWGLEPLDRTRPDWQTRYAAVFRAPAHG